MKRTNQRYAGCTLDRAAGLRKDTDWVAQRFADPDSRILPVWRNRNLVRLNDSGGEAPVLIALTRNRSKEILKVADEKVFLGIGSDAALFAVDISSLSQTESEGVVSGA